MGNEHDSRFKQLVRDFPEDTLRWLWPQAEEHFGKIIKVQFLRQEMPKRWLDDEGRELDIPVHYTFESQEVVITLIEHQYKKSAFSIHKIAHYTIDAMEAFPNVPVLPIVVFADEAQWREDVPRKLESQWDGETWFSFKYHKVKLKNIDAIEALKSDNPVLHVLTPTLDTQGSDRLEIITQAYIRLYGEVEWRRFSKYIAFIDAYAKIQPNERQQILQLLEQEPRGVMIREYIEEIGFQKGEAKGASKMVLKMLQLKFQSASQAYTDRVLSASQSELDLISERLLNIDEIEEVFEGL